jgi:hypothetical protein
MTDKAYNELFLNTGNSSHLIIGEACLEAMRYRNRREERDELLEIPARSAGLTAAPGGA